MYGDIWRKSNWIRLTHKVDEEGLEEDRLAMSSIGEGYDMV
jgi:hypothetical protein